MVGSTDLYGRTTVKLPSGETDVFHQQHVEEGLDARFRSIDPSPADEGQAGVGSRCWTATLTATGADERDMGFAPSRGVDPPALFVVATLNAVAAEGWTVHHVAEDRAMHGQDVRLVSVRYLLRRDASAGDPAAQEGF